MSYCTVLLKIVASSSTLESWSQVLPSHAELLEKR